MVDNRLKEGLQVRTFICHIRLGNTVTAVGINNGEIKLFIIGIQFHEQFEDFVFYFRNTRIRLINLINDHDGF